MCGIAGIVGISNNDTLRRMIREIKHRGPDDEGYYEGPSDQVSLAMCRLSIIDLAGGHQPMSNEDDSLWLVCNGEIYNSPRLRSGLLARGHRFKTHNSDVEVLLHLYEERGPAFIQELNGMFAFVIYDRKKRLLFGGRDRMGIKPFYYTEKGGGFAFASELKSLLFAPGVSRGIDQGSLYHYLSLQYVPAPKSIFTDIKKLPAGHSFTYDLVKKEFSSGCYWQLDVAHKEAHSPEKWEGLVREKLKEAILRWTLSDVPIACSLSGGLDSSSLVGFLAQSGCKDIRTYSLGFEEAQAQDLNELPFARAVAKKWGTRHHEMTLTANKVLDDLDRMVWHLDEPYGGGLPSWYIYEVIGKDVKVALTGTGGDELFGNYFKYRWAERPLALHWLKMLKMSLDSRSAAEMTSGLSYPFGYFYPKYFSDARKDKFFLEKMVSGVPTEKLIEDLAQKSGTKSNRDRVAFIDFHLQLPEEFLQMTDRFSMAHGVEARVPFLDHELVELVYKMPDKLRAMPGDPKGFLKKVACDYLPSELLSAPKKGFTLPLKLWTLGQLRPSIEEMLCPAELHRQGIFSSAVYHEIVKPHLDGRRDLTAQVWTLFMFQKWHKTFA